MAKLISKNTIGCPIISMVLEITGEEADALRSVLAHVGGNKGSTRRGLVDNIALVLADVMGSGYKNDLTGTVNFTQT